MNAAKAKEREFKQWLMSLDKECVVGLYMQMRFEYAIEKSMLEKDLKALKRRVKTLEKRLNGGADVRN